MGNLVELSMGRYGNDVVQECFVPSKEKVPSVPLLQRGLDAFLRLPDEQLRELVQNHWAGYVLRRLLQTSVEVSIRLSFLSSFNGNARAGRALDRYLRLVFDLCGTCHAAQYGGGGSNAAGRADLGSWGCRRRD